MIPAARVSTEDYAFWQRRAGGHLGQILAMHGRLHTLRWSLDPYGFGLRGEVCPASDYTGPYEMERVFAEWVKALALTLTQPMPGRLTATGQIDGCRITVTASLPMPPERKDTT